MTQAAFERGDWQAVIEAHPLESHDPQAWLRYGVALLQTITPGPEAIQQQQQAALAFMQAQKEGANVDAVQAHQRLSVLLSLGAALEIAEQANVAKNTIQLAKEQQAINGTVERIRQAGYGHHWLQASEAFKALQNLNASEALVDNTRETLMRQLLHRFAPNCPGLISSYAELNSCRSIDEVIPEEAQNAFEASAQLIEATPLVLLGGSNAAKSNLNMCPYWIAYGNVRTGSTMVFNLLRILANSLANGVISAWEGDLASPDKFFEIINESPGVQGGVLKIHRDHYAVNEKLQHGQAKAILTHRNMRDACYSYWRMLHNPKSAFYRHEPSPGLIKEFVGNEIKSFQTKASLPNTLIIQEDELRHNTVTSIRKISQFVGCTIHTSSVEFLGSYLSPAGMRRLANTRSSSRNSTGHESITYLHPDHIACESSASSCGEEVKQVIDNLLAETFSDYLDSKDYIKPRA